MKKKKQIHEEGEEFATNPTKTQINQPHGDPNPRRRRRIWPRRKRIWPKKKNLNNQTHFLKTQTQNSEKKNTPKSKHNPTERFGFVAHRKAGMMKACRMQTILTELWGWANLVFRWDNHLDSLKLANFERIFLLRILLSLLIPGEFFWCFYSFFEGIIHVLENQSLDFFIDVVCWRNRVLWTQVSYDKILKSSSMDSI